MGIDYLLGMWAAIAALVLVFTFRFMLPITIGSYFGAVEVLGWPWWGGVLFAAPGLVFILPAVLGGIVEMFGRR